jgi:hypothetical protein
MAVQTVSAIFYCAAPLALFAMAWSITRAPGYSFFAALFYSLLSPAQILAPDGQFSVVGFSQSTHASCSRPYGTRPARRRPDLPPPLHPLLRPWLHSCVPRRGLSRRPRANRTLAPALATLSLTIRGDIRHPRHRKPPHGTPSETARSNLIRALAIFALAYALPARYSPIHLACAGSSLGRSRAMEPWRLQNLRRDIRNLANPRALRTTARKGFPYPLLRPANSSPGCCSHRLQQAPPANSSASSPFPNRNGGCRCPAVSLRSPSVPGSPAPGNQARASRRPPLCRRRTNPPSTQTRQEHSIPPT